MKVLQSFYFHIFVLLILFSLQILIFQDASVNAKTITSICLGYIHGCASFSDKQVKCWGSKAYIGFNSASSDYFGDSTSEIGDSLPYINVGTGVGIDQVLCGYQHVCVKLDTSKIKCLGFNNYGQIGIGTTNGVIGAETNYVGDNLPEVNVGTGLNVLDVALGQHHVCAKLTGNKVKCHGRNDYGQLGYGDMTIRGTSPAHMGDNLQFLNLGSNVQVASVHSSSSANHNCIILSVPTASAQRIKCWGRGSEFQLGYGTVVPGDRGDELGEMGDSLPLVDFGTESKVKQLALGQLHTCAMLVNNALKCFGSGQSGQIGSGSTSSISATGNAMPSVSIDSGKTIKFLSAGISHTCIVYDDMTTMKCIGANNYGQLGQGDKINRGGSTTTVIPSVAAIQLGINLLTISSLFTGQYVNCVVFSDSSMKCFGFNTAGQLLIGTNIDVGDNAGEMGGSLQFSVLFSPTSSPTQTPTRNPIIAPTLKPTQVPTLPIITPTRSPSKSPTNPPTLPTTSPTLPTQNPSASPIKAPTLPTKVPSASPIRAPTLPTQNPSAKPTVKPTINPLKAPTATPSSKPTTKPTKSPQAAPTTKPTVTPTRRPSKSPIREPTTKPSKNPTRKPSKSPDRLCTYGNKKKCKADPKCQWSNSQCSPL